MMGLSRSHVPVPPQSNSYPPSPNSCRATLAYPLRCTAVLDSSLFPHFNPGTMMIGSFNVFHSIMSLPMNARSIFILLPLSRPSSLLPSPQTHSHIPIPRNCPISITLFKAFSIYLVTKVLCTPKQRGKNREFLRKGLGSLGPKGS